MVTNNSNENKKRKVVRYWDNRYKGGGISGKPARNELGEFRHDVIQSFVDIYSVKIIDYGCGDLGFWKDYDLNNLNYIGIDISEVILKQNRNKYPDVKFYHTSENINETAEVVLCFSVLFHILDEDQFLSILNKLQQLSTKFIFIYT